MDVLRMTEYTFVAEMFERTLVIERACVLFKGTSFFQWGAAFESISAIWRYCGSVRHHAAAACPEVFLIQQAPRYRTGVD